MKMAEVEDATSCCCELTVPFLSARDAEVAYTSLVVDPEPKRSGVKKVLRVEGSTLTVSFHAKEARMLRVAVGTFFDLLILVIDTIREFGTS